MSRQVIKVIDSHTGGEPTRVVFEGEFDLGEGSVSDKLKVFSEKYDRFRCAVINEPRGSDVMVGAFLFKPDDDASLCAVIFFNNDGYLGMCGHATIGVIASLAHLNTITPGVHMIETSVGIVRAILHENGEVSVRNVPSYRYREGVAIEIEGFGTLHGDVAWGGNWFFLVEDHRQELVLSNVVALTEFSWKIRKTLESKGIAGKDGAVIDHIELFAPTPTADSRNFVLCPGKAYDRSPCGTGTSAKLACLYESGKLKEGEIWRQEGILRTVFEGRVEVIDGQIFPTIRGRAYVNSVATQILDSEDPFCWGIGANVKL